MIGETVAHYRVQSELGSGGMGVVYRAEDLKLARAVALKFLSAPFADDPAVHDRFLREARAAASLSHANICTIYEINDSGPQPFIAMELLEGQTLQQRLTSGALTTTELLDVAIQVADALAAAHAKGVVHRDIKPGNIFVTADGRAKVVDFGLAKAVAPIASQRNDTNAETILGENVLATRQGTTMGTVAYMSPEQARGEAVDPRSDLFSFGAVLYEMACGRRAFDGTTTAVVFDGILNRTPLPPSSINPLLPVEVEQVISCAIEKDRARRYQSAADIARDLRHIRRTSDHDVVVPDRRFAPSAAGPVSPGWGVTPASGVHAALRRTGRWRRGAIGGAVVLMAVFAVLAWWLSRKPVMAEGSPVLVSDFANRTGDPDFDATLKQALVIKLGESPYVRIVAQQRVQDTLKLMARKPDEPITPALGLEMCQRIGGGALMTGEISKFGSSYVLAVAAQSCTTGDEIAREQTQIARKEDVLSVLGNEVSAVRERLGESLASIQKHNKPLAEATTSSLAALKSFTLGDQRHDKGADLDAIPFYMRAIEQDPQFAVAYARLGTVYANTGEAQQAKRYYEKAYQLRDRAGDRERMYIMGHYYRTNGELAKAVEVYELWHQTYPHDHVPVQNAGVVYEEMGDMERALQAFRDAAQMEPRNALTRQAVAEALFSLGRFDEARQTALKILDDLGDLPAPHLILYQADYLTGNQKDMPEQARKLAGTPLDVDRQGIDYQIATYEGRFRDAAAILRQVVPQAEAASRIEAARSMVAGDILNRAIAGFTSDTRAEASRLLALRPPEQDSITLAFALALSGDVQRARAISTPAWAKLRSDPIYERVIRPAFDGLLEIREGRPARAVEVLKNAETWEERSVKAGMVSADVRGRAYLALGDGKAAEAQFQKRLSTFRHDPFDVARMASRAGIARARALAGDKAGARKAYEELFKLWKGADPDIPLLQRARAEYSALGQPA